jgi:coatomer subunit beta
MEFLGDSNNPSALDVVAFVRYALCASHSPRSLGIHCSEVVENFPALRPVILQKLIESLSSIKSGKVYRGVLWILGEYVENPKDIEATLAEVRNVIGEIPMGASEQRALDEAVGDSKEPNEKVERAEKEKEKTGSKPKVLADGTYASETAFASPLSAKLEAIQASSKPPLRSE